MTCIIGMEWMGKVYMGADSIAMDGTYDYDLIQGSKMFRIGKQHMLIGCAGQPRQAQIIKHHAHLPSDGGDLQRGLPGYQDPTDEEYLIAFIENIREALRDYGCMEIQNGVETGCNLLIGFHGALYSVENHFQLHRSRRGFLSTGIGSTYAEASLLTQVLWQETYGSKAEPEAMIERALDISTRLSVGVARPFHIEVLEA